MFQVCIQNRYKLNKKLRKYLSQTNSNANLLEDKSLLNQHKVCHLNTNPYLLEEKSLINQHKVCHTKSNYNANLLEDKSLLNQHNVCHTKSLTDLLQRQLHEDKVSNGAKIRNRYNQVPILTHDTNGKVTNSQLDTTNESQDVIPFST